MQSIHFIKRILFYIGLSLISFVITIVLDGIFRESPKQIFVLFVFLIPHYIFGLVFLRTKWIFKLTVPFVTALASFGILWILWGMLYMYGSYIMFLAVFISTATVWEIAYQVLRVICRKQIKKD
jgi:hypothetical protein